MNFIKKIVDKKIDGAVHLQFQKFSRGEFRDRAGISAKKVGNKYTINTTAEFANELVVLAAEKLGKAKENVSGVVVTTAELGKEIPYKSKSQFQGIKKYAIDGDMSGEEIIKFVKSLPKVFFALSFKFPEGELKIKPKLPKSGKPSSKNEDGESKKPDFCKLITTDESIGKSFIFEKPDFKQADIIHTFFINDIVVPTSLKNEKDFAKVREGALRKGKILRIAKIDCSETKKEYEFEA
ncbi:Uncharacterised protein [uncultured archaeon]|nr:Uncharacterised protein [uncultured archaeon]